LTNLSEEKLLNRHYVVHSQLKYLRKIIELRGYIINFLQNIIAILSELLGHKSELKIEGLTTLEEVDKNIILWNKGEIDFKDIMEFYYNS